MKVRPRKPQAGPSFPMVPHFHTCRGHYNYVRAIGCASRHKWTCWNRTCVWAVLNDCDTAMAAREKSA